VKLKTLSILQVSVSSSLTIYGKEDREGTPNATLQPIYVRSVAMEKKKNVSPCVVGLHIIENDSRILYIAQNIFLW
jgi:hypothetical protein